MMTDGISKRLAAGVLYLLAVAMLMQDYAAAYAVAVVLMAATAVLLVASVVATMRGKAGARWLTALSEWVERLRITGGLLLCACVCYSRGSVSAGHVFLALALVSAAAELTGALKRKK